jgi:uncharacterized protein YndB with AHSA1/START domain
MSFAKSYAIPAKPAPVFELLTSPMHLKGWFAEEADAGAKPGAPFRFWGRHTLWMPAAADAKQTLSQFAFPHTLAFTWTWRGAPTEVTVKVAADGEGARVDVAHAFAKPWPGGDPELGPARAARQDALVAAFWDVAFANLAYYAFEGEPLLLPDYTAAGDALELSLAIEAPAAAVFAALTEPKQLDGWIAEKAEVEPRKGGAYRFGWAGPDGAPVGPTQIHDFAPGERLAHDFAWPGEPPTRVRWELEASEPVTTVRFTHERGERAFAADTLLWCGALLALRGRLTPA